MVDDYLHRPQDQQGMQGQESEAWLVENFLGDYQCILAIVDNTRLYHILDYVPNILTCAYFLLTSWGL